MAKFILFLASSAALIFFSGCGGGGGGKSGNVGGNEVLESTVYDNIITEDILTGKHLVGNHDTGSVHFYFDTSETLTFETTDTNGTYDIYSRSEGNWRILDDNATVLLQMPDQNVSVTFEQEPADRDTAVQGHFAVAGKPGYMQMFWEEITFKNWWYKLDPFNDEDLEMMNDKRLILALPGENVLLDLNSSGDFTLSSLGGDIAGTWELYKEFSGALQLEADPENGKLHLNYLEVVDGQETSVDLFIGFRRAPTEADVPLLLTAKETDLFYAGHLVSVTDLTSAQ